MVSLPKNRGAHDAPDNPQESPPPSGQLEPRRSDRLVAHSENLGNTPENGDNGRVGKNPTPTSDDENH
jgi:hypothetical protein